MLDSKNGRVARSDSRHKLVFGIVFAVILVVLFLAWAMNTGNRNEPVSMVDTNKGATSKGTGPAAPTSVPR
jgi:hypothetical protein